MQKLTINMYAWLMAVFFGAVLAETVILYPNIFHNVPESLSESMKFLRIIGPRQFFTVFGPILVVVGIIANVLNWRNRQSTVYLVSSFALLFFFEFLFSVFYFWPRNQIMFVEGITLHSAEDLQRVAVEFQRGHFIRLAIAFIASLLAFLGMHRNGKNTISSAK